MHRRARLPVVTIALLAVVGGCTADDSAGPATSDSTTRPSGEVATFCDAWNAAAASGDDSAFDEVLAVAPSELEEEAALVREADASSSESPEAEAAAAEIFDWIELHCQRGDAGDSQRHVAPPVDTAFDGLTFCETTAFPVSSPDGQSGMVLYGEASADDPYDGPMLGVFWNPADDGSHRGDGDTQPVTVRGNTGVAAPITVFQQTILPELGTVIAWTEGNQALGLYGRRWPIDRAHELVEIANQLDDADGRFRIADEALPDGYREIFTGDASVTSILIEPSPLYSLRYEGEAGLLNVNALQMSDDEFEAFRFFTVGVDQAEVAGRDALIGDAWFEGGPAVVTWREPDGLVVRIVGIGVPLETARQVAERSRELSGDEWAALVEAEDHCPER